MPFESKAQRRKFYALKSEGKMDQATIDKWEGETPKDLPEKKAAFYLLGAKLAETVEGGSLDTMAQAEDFGSTAGNVASVDAKSPPVTPKRKVPTRNNLAGGSSGQTGFAKQVMGALAKLDKSYSTPLTSKRTESNPLIPTPENFRR